MPGGFERLNERRRRPNERISFIKPLDGCDKTIAQDFLERIAAICNPIMKQDHLVVTTLEEYEPNREFVGRNFNGGEVIQLVLKAPFSGHWLPFNYVAHVMMHELAHCKQMNHSKAFWKVKNAFSEDLRRIQAQGYTGDGLWSKGVALASGQFERQVVVGTEIIPKYLCGGTYRSNRKRKSVIRPKETHKERQAKRIAKKFGIGGQTLGADEKQKVTLEKGKRPPGKPRVAGSMRGRELRAAAALARFDSAVETAIEESGGDLGDTDVECSGAETADDDLDDLDCEDAKDLDGRPLLDRNGHSMARVCEGENHDEESHREREELNDYMYMANSRDSQNRSFKEPGNDSRPLTDEGCMGGRSGHSTPTQAVVRDYAASSSPDVVRPVSKIFEKERDLGGSNAGATCPDIQTLEVRNCKVCSMENDMKAIACIACQNVLDGLRIASAWKCQSRACLDGAYVNTGERRLCGACGARKSS